MGHRRWTADEDAYLVAHYSRQTLRAIGEQLGRNPQVVQERVEALIRRGQLCRDDRCYNRPWTHDEDDWLAEHWGKLGDATVARRLRRTVAACKIHVKRGLGSNRKSNLWTARVVGALFGVDAKTIVVWIERGWLKGRPSPTRSGANHCWNVEEESIERFVREMGWAYDHRRMAEGEYLTRLAKRVHQADPWLTIPEAARFLGWSLEGVGRRARLGDLPCRRRPKQGQGGNPGGLIVIRKADLVGFLERVRRETHRNRSEARKRVAARRREQAA